MYTPEAAQDFFSRKRLSSSIPDVDKEILARLKSVGILLAQQLLERGRTPALRMELSALTGIDCGRLLYFVQCCDLVRLTGVSGRTLLYLMETGHDSVEKIARREPDELREIISLHMLHSGIRGKMPQCCDIGKVVMLAKMMPAAVECET